MKSDYKKARFIILASAFVLCAQIPIMATTDDKPAHSKSTSSAKHSEKKSPEKDKKAANLAEAESKVAPDNLIQAAQAYQDKADENSYNALWDNFLAFVQQDVAKHKDPATLFKSSKVFSQAGLNIINPAGANAFTHIYVFNHMPQGDNLFVPQTKCALLQWSDQSIVDSTLGVSHSGRRKKLKTKRSQTVAVLKSQFINVPSSVDIKEATFLPRAVVVAKTTKIKGGKVNKISKISVSTGRYLAISGSEFQSGHTWILGLKQNVGSWSNYPDVFQDVPPFLIQSANAKIKFSCNNLVISMGGPNGYELAMPFVEDHFAFSTKEAQDSATAIAHQFLMALQFKRMDMAKVWLVDPKLASIPGYLGLYNRGADSPPLRLANMPQPICGGSRFRLITGGKDDLIIDIAKIKNQILIKALFIAPGIQQINLISKTNQN